jgi:putative ABC transport system permease protein
LSGTRQAELVAIVSEELARRMWPNEDPIGKRFGCCEGDPSGQPRWKTVVGVVGDVRSRGPTQDVYPEFYLPIDQAPPAVWEWLQRTMTLVARGDGEGAQLAPAMRAAVRAVDPTLPLYAVATMREAARTSTATARFNTMLLATLGAIGLVLAVVGIYGVIAYFVSLRTQEIGVRMALGATARDVLGLLTWQGLKPIALGIALGAAAALAATRLLASSLYGVTANDPLTFGAVVVVLAGAGLLATLLPARRATRVSPTTAMRSN